MATAGAYPNPVGIADVVTCTTHKTLMGPRGAIIMTTDEDLAQRIDMAVFPGEQGGPHTQKFAAMAVAFKIAASDAYRRLMWRIKENAAALADGLTRRGLRLAYGGTDTHFCMLDLNSVRSRAGAPLRGEPAARILDMAGIVANKNTIPGDTQTSLAMGIRLGTPWLTQRGYGPKDMDEIARLIHKTVTGIRPFSYTGLSGELPRGKIDLDLFEEIKAEVGIPAAARRIRDRGPHTLPAPSTKCRPGRPGDERAAGASIPEAELTAASPGAALLDVFGLRPAARPRRTSRGGLNQIVTCDAPCMALATCSISELLRRGRSSPTASPARLVSALHPAHQPDNHERTRWLRGLGDGDILFDPDDDLERYIEDIRWSAPALARTGRATAKLHDRVRRDPCAAGMQEPSAADLPAVAAVGTYQELVVRGDGAAMLSASTAAGALPIGPAALQAPCGSPPACPTTRNTVRWRAKSPREGPTSFEPL